MSDAIRCGQCRWWNRIHRQIPRGICEIDTACYIGGDPVSIGSWHQPMMPNDGGCSRGSPKAGSTITVKITEEKLQPRRFEEET